MHQFLLFISCMALLLVPSGANADETGDTGSIAGLERYTDLADTFLQMHGRMYVKTSTALDEYRWGGTSCGTRILTDAEFAAVQATQNNKKMLIEPRYLIGQGAARCLVGFRLVEKKNLKLFP